jgi:hypothetical protein
MLSYNRRKIRLNTDILPSANAPARKQSSHVGVESIPGRTETAKKMPAPDISIIEQQRAWEHTQLRQELEYQRRKHGASMYLLEEVTLVVETLQQALVNFQKLNSDFEDEVVET